MPQMSPTCERSPQAPSAELSAVLADLPFELEGHARAVRHLRVAGLPEGHGGGVQDVIQLQRGEEE